ncbi:MAG TPA: SpoIIE family protein phosphatase [Candidatus Angelobacter sp.]|nr:SpoIIE family protein phosphatase [Candidatus Angelobacter sp.]
MSLNQPSAAVVEWASAGRATDEPSEGSESGDLEVVTTFENGTMVAVIDGLGHGAEAALAARTAAKVMEEHFREPAELLVQRCHGALRKTRGVVMGLACFNATASSMTWIGVGNIQGVLFRWSPGRGAVRQDLVSRGGIVGYQLPPLRSSTFSISFGDTLILTTDGIRREFAADLNLEKPPKEIAEFVLDQHSKKNDDALVVVARYVGETP